jgi:ubiquinone/menaquinone biosynthesis C-methylase UbiE
MDSKEYTQNVIQLFNTVAHGYDNPATRLFPFCADKLVEMAHIAPGEKVLDVATGTGAVAVSAAQMARHSRVIAIDLSNAMLSKAEMNITKMALTNVDLFEMDAQRLDFKSHYFDVVLCSFGLFFLPDMPAAVHEWHRVLNPGGRLLFTSFSRTAFTPMADLFHQRLDSYDVEYPDPESPMGWYRLADVDTCEDLLRGAGLKNFSVQTRQMGYHLNCADDWWELCWNTGFRGLLQQLSEDELDEFRQRHMSEVEELMDDKGLWLNLETHFCYGEKPD